MKNKFLSKVAAAMVVLLVGVVSLTMEADVTEHKIKVYGTDEKTTLGVFDTSVVSYIQITESYPDATIENNGDIIIDLTSDLSFRMILVEGGVDYALRSSDITWTTTQKTKKIEAFYLGQFEVTQGIWKNIKGSVPSSQSATGDNLPVSQVSWDMIAGTASDTFLKLINKKLADIKKNNPAVADLLGNREFRLPSEWEWEYAAAGGKNWSSLNYYYSGTSESTGVALQTVAVNKVSPNTATSVARVGSKLPNALGLYDMSGNVREWCSGLGYPGNTTTPGYLGDTSSWNSSLRPNRGGSWSNTTTSYFRVYGRTDNITNGAYNNLGFRLAL